MINLELIAKFNEIAINNRIDPFFEADISSYFDNASQFSLGIKRAKKVALYGVQHVKFVSRYLII